MFWSVEVLSDGSKTVFTSRVVNGKWARPEVFSKGEDVLFISPDGKKLFCVGALDSMHAPYRVEAGFIEELRPE